MEKPLPRRSSADSRARGAVNQSANSRSKGAVNQPANSRAKGAASPAAGRNNSGGKTAKKRNLWPVFFWITFFILVLVLFIYNRDNIRRTLQDSQAAAENVIFVPETTASLPAAPEPENIDAVEQTVEFQEPEAPPPQADELSAESQAEFPAEQAQPPAAAVERERTMYFISIDRDGTILRTKVNRSLPVTESPLTDTLGSLLAGPEPEELRRGLISLIPAGTRLVNAAIRGNTAYINLNEDFQFNTYGVEGYAGALRQIVWTATEFSNIRDVQILIEGRRIDYLGEGVWIGSPISRDML